MTPEVIQQELQSQQLEQQKKGLRFYSNLNTSESVLLKFQKKSSVLLESSTASTIISPGVFFSAVAKVPPAQDKQNGLNVNSSQTINQGTQHKLYVSVPDYGILKNHGRYIENCTLLDTTGTIKQIASLTPTFNATQKPEATPINLPRSIMLKI